MWKPLEVVKANASSHPKMWIAIGLGVAGIVILAETRRRRRSGTQMIDKEDFGAFLERFELLPFPQPPPPAARQSLAGLTFAIKDMYWVFWVIYFIFTGFIYFLFIFIFDLGLWLL